MTILAPIASDKLTRKQRSHLSRAVRLAERSAVPQRHGAIIVKGGSVLAHGVNSYSNDPRMFPITLFGEEKLPHSERGSHLSVHAELAALRKVNPEQLKGAVVYVARVNRRGEPGNSAPCAACADELRKAGVKRVIYT